MADWVSIYSSLNPNLTQIIKSVLEDHNIEVVLINKMDSMHIHLFVGEIEVYAEQDNAMRATHLITKHEL